MASIRCEVCGHEKRVHPSEAEDFRAVAGRLKCTECGARKAVVSGGTVTAEPPSQPARGPRADVAPSGLSIHPGFTHDAPTYEDDEAENRAGVEDEMLSAIAENDGWQEGYDY